MKLPLCMLTGFSVLAQNPYDPSVGHYKLEIENEYVRVSRAFYGPREKAPVHTHPQGPTVYVYTTDGGPMVFMHLEYALVRKPVVAGQIRFNRGAIETHSVEYEGDSPTEYFRVELRTEPLELPGHDVRIGAYDPSPFENAQIRIRRVPCAAKQDCGQTQHHTVVVGIENRTAAFMRPGGVVRNEGERAVRQVWIELKSPPRD